MVMLDFVTYYIGEVVLYLLTFGWRKPRWNIGEYPRDGRAWRSMLVGYIVFLPIGLFLALVAYVIFGTLLGG